MEQKLYDFHFTIWLIMVRSMPTLFNCHKRHIRFFFLFLHFGAHSFAVFHIKHFTFYISWLLENSNRYLCIIIIIDFVSWKMLRNFQTLEHFVEYILSNLHSTHKIPPNAEIFTPPLRLCVLCISFQFRPLPSQIYC